MKRLAGVEASTGSLGQGLSIGIGHALAARVDKKSYHTYVMTGDGELGEGQNWEAAAAAVKYKLDNLTLIVDRNHFQQTGRVRRSPQHGPDRRQVHGVRLEYAGRSTATTCVKSEGLRAGPRGQGPAELHRQPHAQGTRNSQPAAQAGRHEFSRQADAGKTPGRSPRRSRFGW